MATKKQIPDINEQWRLWQIENEPERFEHIDTDELRQAIIADLTVKSQMDVREYTLYQKWCEVHEKFPTRNITTLYGQETQLVDKSNEKVIQDIKDNIWMPESPDDSGIQILSLIS